MEQNLSEFDYGYVFGDFPAAGQTVDRVLVYMSKIHDPDFPIIISSGLNIAGLNIKRNTPEYRKLLDGVAIATSRIIAARRKFAWNLQGDAPAPTGGLLGKAETELDTGVTVTLTFEITHQFRFITDAYEKMLKDFGDAMLTEVVETLRAYLPA